MSDAKKSKWHRYIFNVKVLAGILVSPFIIFMFFVLYLFYETIEPVTWRVPQIKFDKIEYEKKNINQFCMCGDIKKKIKRKSKEEIIEMIGEPDIADIDTLTFFMNADGPPSGLTVELKDNHVKKSHCYEQDLF